MAGFSLRVAKFFFSVSMAGRWCFFVHCQERFAQETKLDVDVYSKKSRLFFVVISLKVSMQDWKAWSFQFQPKDGT